MSELTHTPGPWSVVAGYYPGMLDIVGPSFKITVVTTAIDLEFKDFVARTNDCHLIAAAPDLLKALEGMIQVYGGGTQWDPPTSTEMQLHDLARAAIAKAGGQS